MLQYAMKSTIRANGISANEISDNVSGMQVLKTCTTVTQTWKIDAGIFFCQVMSMLFHAKVE